MLNKRKVDVYAALGEVIIKFIIGISCVIAFFWVLGYLISANTAVDAAKFATLEAILGSTFYILIGFYFGKPAVDNKKSILLYSALIISIVAIISSGLALILILNN